MVWQKIYHEKLIPQLKQLDATHPNDFSTETIRQFNKIHSRITTIRLQMAPKARRLRMGQIPWSQEWANAQIKYQAWLLLLKWRKRNSSSRKLQRLRTTIKKAKLSNAFNKSIPQIVTELRKAKKRLKQVSSEANEL